MVALHKVSRIVNDVTSVDCRSQDHTIEIKKTRTIYRCLPASSLLGITKQIIFMIRRYPFTSCLSLYLIQGFRIWGSGNTKHKFLHRYCGMEHCPIPAKLLGLIYFAWFCNFENWEWSCIWVETQKIAYYGVNTYIMPDIVDPVS